MSFRGVPQLKHVAYHYYSSSTRIYRSPSPPHRCMLQRHRSRYSRVPSAPSTSTSTVAPPYTRLTRRKLLFILCTFLAFASLTIPLLLPSFGSSMRLCLPLNLTRVSEQLHRAVACASPSVPAAILAASTSASIASTRLQTLARPLTTTTSPATSTVARQSFSISASSSIIPSAAATNTSNMATSVTPGRLADWLLSQKEAFLGDLAAGRGKGWLVAMGNEAGGECCVGCGFGRGGRH